VNGDDALNKYLADRGLTPDPIKVANKTDMVTKLTANLADNKTYLAIASPTATQKDSQIKALTRQVNKLIRLSLNNLDGTD
jgi:fructose-1-phosphate kinase PfkB-like protein